MRTRVFRAPPVVPFLAATLALAQAPPARDAADSRKEGRELFRKVVEALGSAGKVAAAKDVRVEASVTIRTEEGALTIGIVQTTVLPGRLRQEIQASFGTMTTVVTEKDAFLVTPDGLQDLPPPALAEQRKELALSILRLAQRPSDPKLSLSAAGRAKVGGVDTAILDVSYDGAEARWFVDPATGRILRTRVLSNRGEGDAERLTDYSDFRPVDGLVFAFHQETTIDGKKEQTIDVTRIQVNTSPDIKIFDRPAPPR